MPHRPLPRLEPLQQALQHLQVQVGPVLPKGPCFSAFSGNDLVHEPCISLSLIQNQEDPPPATGQRLALAHRVCDELGVVLRSRSLSSTRLSRGPWRPSLPFEGPTMNFACWLLVVDNVVGDDVVAA